MNLSYTFNEKIQFTSTKEKISINELTQEDVNTILEPLVEEEGILRIIDMFGGIFLIEDPEMDKYEEDLEYYYEEY